MSEPFVGEIRMFAGNFAPRGWALCDGQLVAVSQNNALFALIGTIYGGDGRNTFGLPDLRGRLPVHQGAGAGLSDRRIGQKGGAETATLTVNQIPSHRHSAQSTTTAGGSDTPSGNLLADSKAATVFGAASPPEQTLRAETVGRTGGGQPHSNMMPSLCVNFIIALVGIFPSRQ